ncbi:MAG: hypothetical protein AAFV07_12035, partial [Bacteroidota bacterium]
MKQAYLLVFFIGILAFGCKRNSPTPDEILNLTPQAPAGLSYATVTNAREFSAFFTSPPTYNSYGAVPKFEIVALRDGNGNAVADEVLTNFVSIINPTDEVIITDQEYTVTNSQNIGQIVFAAEHPLGVGRYVFDIKMTTQFDDQLFETLFENALELDLGPTLASGVIFVPGGQNLLSGTSDRTTEPLVFGANPDIRFELGDFTDRLTIDEKTGQIGVASGYTPSAEPEIIKPTVNIISNISEEVVSFSDAITIYLSKDPVTVPKATVNVFYPTLEAENTEFGYSIHVVEEGDPDMVWNSANPSPLTAEDRPADNVNQKRIFINLVKPSVDAQVPHESWVILNSQDLSAYEFGFDVEAEFFTKNRFVEYLSTD